MFGFCVVQIICSYFEIFDSSVFTAAILFVDSESYFGERSRFQNIVNNVADDSQSVNFRR